MQNILQNATDGDRKATSWILLIMLAGYAIVGLLLFTLVAQALLLPFFDFDFGSLMNMVSSPYGIDGARVYLIFIQGVTSIGGFIILPLFFVRRHLHLSLNIFFTRPTDLYRPLLMSTLIVFSFMVLNSVIIEWNQNMVLPGFLSGFEDWAKAKELQLERLTIYLTDFESPREFLFALLVIAVVPGIGEELLFRGLVQNLFTKALGNAHIAIWVSALIFAAFHMQFYGLVPRMLLGAMFGYLYYWSGHLSLAMFAHFLHNGFTLLMVYLSQKDVTDFNPITDATSPSVTLVLTFAVIGVALMFLYRSYFRRLASE